jgi:hypothetical protein
VTDLRTRSEASRKAQRSRKRQQAARAEMDPAVYGPQGSHRGSARVDGVHSIQEILGRIRRAEAAE